MHFSKHLAVALAATAGATIGTPALATDTNLWIFTNSVWTVPYSTVYNFVLAGGAGGDNYPLVNATLDASYHSGGGGSVAVASIFLDAGSQLTFMIGQRGGDGYFGAGGGGASAIYESGTLELVAGGGGGAGGGGNGIPGNHSLNGTSTGDAMGGTGGTGGQGGHGTYNSNWSRTAGGGGGGAGVLGPGGTVQDGNGVEGIGGNGPVGGGSPDHFGYGGSGAFGGGSGQNVFGAGGGGGGYSGGAGGDAYSFYEFPLIRYTGRGGGGGSSYNPWAGGVILPGASPLSGYALVTYDYTPPAPPTPSGPQGNTGSGGTFPGAVPEPASWAMMLVGFAAVGAMLRTATRRSPAPQAA